MKKTCQKLTPIPNRKIRPPEGRSRRAAGDSAGAAGDQPPDLSHIALGLRHLAVPIEDLHFHPANPRQHDERNIAVIRGSLITHGQYRPAIISRRTGQAVVIVGNGMLAAALAEGWKFLAAEPMELTEDQETELAITDNESSVLATWNQEIMASLARLKASPLKLDPRLGEMMERLRTEHSSPEEATAEDAGPQLDRTDELLKKWGVKRGQLWTIPSKTVSGREHKLCCGDSTDAEMVARLMGGERAAVVITDPPYGISLENHAPGKERRARSFEVIGDGSQDIGIAALALVGDVPRLVFGSPMKPWPGEWKQWLVWDKGGAVGGGGDKDTYWKMTWELIQVGGTGRLNGQRDNAVLGFHVTGAMFNDHPTQKPVKLMAYLLEKTTQPGEIAYEPFSGSGSQFVAGEQLGRLVYGLEIEPRYVAVTLERLSAMGLEARLGL